MCQGNFMTESDIILEIILDGVIAAGSFEMDYYYLRHRSKTIKSDADLRKWAREKSLAYHQKVSRQGKLNIFTAHFSRLDSVQL